MSGLGFNKIAGAALAAGLAVFGLNELSAIVYKSEPPEKMGYAIEPVADAGGGEAAAVELPIDWGTELPKADPAAGATVAKKCESCHKFDPAGTNSTGPGLFGVLGRKPGSHPGFAYSSAMTDFGSKNPAWDYEHINGFLTNPQKYISGTKMTFVGLKKREDRIAVIAYLHTLGSSLPIPAPNPAAAAAPAAPAPGAAPAAGAAPAPGGTVAAGTVGAPTTGAAASAANAAKGPEVKGQSGASKQGPN